MWQTGQPKALISQSGTSHEALKTSGHGRSLPAGEIGRSLDVWKPLVCVSGVGGVARAAGRAAGDFALWAEQAACRAGGHRSDSAVFSSVIQKERGRARWSLTAS